MERGNAELCRAVHARTQAQMSYQSYIDNCQITWISNHATSTYQSALAQYGRKSAVYNMGGGNTGWRKKTGPPSHCKYTEIPWPNCVEIGRLLQYYMLNTVINFLFKDFIALWRTEGWPCRNFANILYTHKTRMDGLWRRKHGNMFSRFDTIPACDGRTDGRTDRSLYLRRASAWLTHVKITGNRDMGPVHNTELTTTLVSVYGRVSIVS